jgi:hypothetical protein
VKTLLYAAIMFGSVGVCTVQAKPQRTTEKAQPKNLFIIAEAVSDASPFWFKYILDLSPEADGLHLRWIRVAPMANSCPGVTVKAMSRVIKESSPGLIQPDICSLSPARVSKILNNARRRSAIDDTVGFGIVASCSSGSATKVFHLPLDELIDKTKLKRTSPDVAALYDTYYGILKSAFSGASFYNIPPERDRELQEEGSNLVSELRSGRFDVGLAQGSMKELLVDYSGIRVDRSETPGSVQLVSPDIQNFVRYVVPDYPSLAKQARLQGDVEVELDVDESTGRVKELRPLNGNSLLMGSPETGRSTVAVQD